MSNQNGRPVSPIEQAHGMCETLPEDLRNHPTRRSQGPVEYADKEEYWRRRSERDTDAAVGEALGTGLFEEPGGGDFAAFDYGFGDGGAGFGREVGEGVQGSRRAAGPSR